MSIIFINWHKVVDKLISTCYNGKYQRKTWDIHKEKGGLTMDELKMFDIVYANFTNSKVGSEQSGIHPYIIIQNNMGN